MCGIFKSQNVKSLKGRMRKCGRGTRLKLVPALDEPVFAFWNKYFWNFSISNRDLSNYPASSIS